MMLFRGALWPRDVAPWMLLKAVAIASDRLRSASAALAAASEDAVVMGFKGRVRT